MLLYRAAHAGEVVNSPSSKQLYGRTSTFGTPLKATKEEEDALLASLDPGDGRRPSKRRPAVMSHEERRAIIEAPFQTVVHTHSSAWGGVFVRESVPTEGRRVWQERPEDEEWMKNRWEEK